MESNFSPEQNLNIDFSQIPSEINEDEAMPIIGLNYLRFLENVGPQIAWEVIGMDYELFTNIDNLNLKRIGIEPTPFHERIAQNLLENKNAINDRLVSGLFDAGREFMRSYISKEFVRRITPGKNFSRFAKWRFLTPFRYMNPTIESIKEDLTFFATFEPYIDPEIPSDRSRAFESLYISFSDSKS